MSIALMTAAFRAEIPTTQKFVLLALCDCANDQGECYPSIQNLQAKTSLRERAVQGAIAWLEANGFLTREIRHGRSTVYTLTPAACAPPHVVHPRSKCTLPPHHMHPTPAPHAPITIREPSRNQKPPQPPRGEVVDKSPWFSRWWEAWPKHPRKAARVQCERKWQALGCEALGEQIVASVEAHKSSAGWAKDDGAFVPAPLVWLNQRRWEAPIAAPKKAEVWVPPPPMSAAERAAADEVRRRVVTALRGRVAA